MSYKAMKLKLVRCKHRIYARYKSNDHSAYVRAQKEAKNEVRKAKHRFESKLADQIKHDKKSFYAYVRSKTKFKARIGPLSNSSGQSYTQNANIAEEFNKYFASVYTKEDTTNIPEASGIYEDTVNNSLQDVLVDRYVIQKRLQKLITDKATGADSLSPWFLSMIEDVIALPISILMRNSLDDGEVPDWKMANISPVYKSGG